MATIALMILGLAISPLLKVKLLPDRSLPSISVSYSYGGANAVVVDSEVTSRLEAIFSSLEGLVKLNSRTGDGNGNITLEMEKDADMDAVRFEVSMLIRQVYPELPAGVSYPQIRVARPDEKERIEHLMSLILNGPGNPWDLGQVAETTVKPTLSVINGIVDVSVSGYNPLQWELVYNITKLKSLGVSPGDIRNQIQDYYKTAGLGMVKQKQGYCDYLQQPCIVFRASAKPGRLGSNSNPGGRPDFAFNRFGNCSKRGSTGKKLLPY